MAQRSMFRQDLFQGRTVVVTGGASGIGLGISTAFSSHGAHVVLLSRNDDRLAAAAAGMENASWRSVDVRDQDGLDAIAKDHPRVDVLVNAAAGNFPSPFDALSPNAFQSVVDIVLGGTANACRSFRPALRAARGNVLNIVAGYAWTGAPGISHSGAAKAGVLNLTRSLAVEWGPDVRVNAVSPGPIDGTEGMKRLGTDLGLDALLQGATPLRRFGTVEEVAAACLFLASPQASYITGACLPVDGGEDALGPFGVLWNAMRDA